MTPPFEIGDLVHFKPSSGFPAGMMGVVVGLEVWVNEDTTITIDGLSEAPDSLLSPDEAISRVVVQIPLQWPENRDLAKIKITSKSLWKNGYIVFHAGPASLELDSTAEVEERTVGDWTFWDAFCDHDRNIHAKGSTPEMARLKLAHELTKQPHIV